MKPQISTEKLVGNDGTKLFINVPVSERMMKAIRDLADRSGIKSRALYCRIVLKQPLTHAPYSAPSV
jgi:hypothetical protein